MLIKVSIKQNIRWIFCSKKEEKMDVRFRIKRLADLLQEASLECRNILDSMRQEQIPENSLYVIKAPNGQYVDFIEAISGTVYLQDRKLFSAHFDSKKGAEAYLKNNGFSNLFTIEEA